MISPKAVIKWIYKVVRSLLFSVTLFVVGIYVLAYILVSIPAFTNFVKNRASTELSNITGGKVLIGSLDVYPFNEAKIKDLQVFDPYGRECIEIETVSGGISLWKLLTEGKIEISFGEIIGLKADIIQEEEGAPLNIQFLIDAFSNKDDKKEKNPFDITLRNVVLRKSSVSLCRPWIENQKIGELDLSHLQISELAADIAFPKISDKGIEVDLRRLSFIVPDIIEVEKLGLKGKFSKNLVQVQNFVLAFPSSRLLIPEINLAIPEGKNITDVLKENKHVLEIEDSYFTPADFSFLNPVLNNFTEPLNLSLNAIGNIEEINLVEFNFGNPEVLELSLDGGVESLHDVNNLKGNISNLELTINSATFQRLTGLFGVLPKNIKEILLNMGNISIKGDFGLAMFNKSLKGNLEMVSNAFNLSFEGVVENQKQGSYKGEGELNIENLHLHHLLPEIPIRNLNLNMVAEGGVIDKNPYGMVSLVVDNFEYKGDLYNGFSINLSKDEELITGDLLINNKIADIEANFSGDLEGESKNVFLDMDIRNLDLSQIIDMKTYKDYTLGGKINMRGNWEDINRPIGELSLTDFSFNSPDYKKRLKLNELTLNANFLDSVQSITLNSDWIDIRIEGSYQFKRLPDQLKNLAASVFPVLISEKEESEKKYFSDIEYDIIIKKNNSVPEFLNLPFRLLVPITLSGSIEGSSNSASLTLNAPYLQQGKDKLVYDTKFIANVDGESGILDALIQTTLPVKKGDLALDVNIFGKNNSVSTDLHWVNTENSDFKGHVKLDTEIGKNELTSTPEILLTIQPSVLKMGSASWNISKSEISYKDKRIDVQGLRIWHDKQYVEIDGVASDDYYDVVTIDLADIDVDYVFDMLQINYVTFGGTATGEIYGRALLSGDPIAETESFIIKDFSYNGSRLGTCLATSKWNNEEKEIEISADISHRGVRRVYGSGGIWLGRDSLCFDIEATKVPVDFVQPFMSVFSSHVGGFATGDVKLFGTFHDIDMTGKIFADSVAVKLDYTNTIYHGSDSVFLNPGQIDIPHFMLYDKNGNSALLTGELTHRFFHDPSFIFRLSDAHDFLCYDTSSDLNPDWYGTLYGTGSANLQGVPGLVEISADMTVSGNSAFTFVLNETEYARDYQFLTFSDKRKEALKTDEPLTAKDFKEMLKKRMHQDEGSLSRFGIDIRATVTPQALFTLVMDPAAGDKITARGRGALQVKYESDDDEMMMYGKYEIDEGNYNFSLQDIILRDFKIKEGSSISFNGNPLAADLDISATYRVNTNLSDLDKSFSTDRDLNRTNVPVDAVLSVEGNMTSPDITFDIELPTLTQDVERKVKSIISTDDMMNRQIIYLLALNRFYTPEYMGSSGNGGELAGFASSTISSQLSNILGQLTDKFSVSPSIRSDKGDFSDIEVDVALSSRLLNNRLLINGNFGYRDRSNSSTTFVGDFDVEYLLSKNGNLRLKAYNHFNDQNYYLREALTTQGLGVVYRKDFDDWFTFLKKRKQNNISSEDDLPETTVTSDKEMAEKDNNSSTTTTTHGNQD